MSDWTGETKETVTLPYVEVASVYELLPTSFEMK